MRNRFAGSSGLRSTPAKMAARSSWKSSDAVGSVGVVAPGQRVHVLLLHAGEAGEELLQHGILGVARGALVEGKAAELDLEGLADRFHRLVVLDRAAVEHLELALAVRAHAVGKGEAFAHLAAVLAAPAQLDARAADVGLLVFEGTLATRADAHDCGSRWTLGLAAGADRPWAARRRRRRPAVIGQVRLPPASQAPIARAARRPAPMARITVAPPVTMSPPANTPGTLVACVCRVGHDVAPLVQARAPAWTW